MAQRVRIQLVDDLTGESLDDGNGRSVEFSIDQKRYQIDLSNENVARLELALQPFVDAARKVGRGSTVSASRRTASRAAENAEIREWAKSQGIHVGDRGRISEEIRDAYAARAK